MVFVLTVQCASFVVPSSSGVLVLSNTMRLATVTTARRLVRCRQRFYQQQVFLSSSSAIASDDNNNLPSKTPSHDNLPSKPIDFAVASKIEGEESHIATIQLNPGETLRAESGAMVYMTEGVEMDTKLAGASSAFSRMLTGQNMFLTDYRYNQETGSGTVCLGTDFPSKILRFSLEDFPGRALICQRGAYLASNPSVNIEMEFTKSLTSGFFGGQGFILQKLSGEGDVLVKGGGTIVQRELKEGETLRVSSGSIVAFEPTVQYDVTMMPGIKNAMFGGEGLFVTTLTGPGRVWLQGMPPDRMIAEIARRVPGPGIGFGIPIGGGGGGAGEAGAEGGEGGAEAAGAAAGEGTSGEEMVAASDAAIDADRQATVASSGMASQEVDSDSPSALFGDAAGTEDVTKETSDDASFSTSTTETTFTDDDFSQEEPSFDDSEFADTSSGDFDDGKLFDDTTTESFSTESTEAAEEGGSGILGTLWDLFTGGDE